MTSSHSPDASAAAASAATPDRPRYDDINVSVLVLVGIISAIVTFLIIVTVQGLAYRMESSFQKSAASLYELNTGNSVKKMIEEQKALLFGGSGEGAARVPIDQAMDRVVEKYAAATPAAADAAKPTEGAEVPAGDH